MSLEFILIPYLWHPKVDLKKQTPKTWKRMDIYHHEKSKATNQTYLFSRYKTRKNGLLNQIITFRSSGEIVSTIQLEYPNENEEISMETARGESRGKNIQRFNDNGMLIEEIATYPYGGTDRTQYFYDEKNRLIQVIQKDDDGDTTWEELIYKNDQLFKIETKNNDGGSLFRGFMYNEKGLLEKMIRMQNELVNLEVQYFYNEKNQITIENHESVNRIKGGKNSLMTTEYDYHPNGQLKTETFKIIDTYKSQTKSKSMETFDENGLMLKDESWDYLKEEHDIYEYKYQFFE